MAKNWNGNNVGCVRLCVSECGGAYERLIKNINNSGNKYLDEKFISVSRAHPRYGFGEIKKGKIKTRKFQLSENRKIGERKILFRVSGCECGCIEIRYRLENFDLEKFPLRLFVIIIKSARVEWQDDFEKCFSGTRWNVMIARPEGREASWTKTSSLCNKSGAVFRTGKSSRRGRKTVRHERTWIKARLLDLYVCLSLQLSRWVLQWVLQFVSTSAREKMLNYVEVFAGFFGGAFYVWHAMPWIF